jgi:hypothetical protein
MARDGQRSDLTEPRSQSTPVDVQARGRRASADAVGPGHRRPGPAGRQGLGWRQPGSLAHTRRLGDNAGMARDDSLAHRPRLPPGRKHPQPAGPSGPSLFPGSVDGHRRAVAPAPPAAADGGSRSPWKPRTPCPMSCGRPGPCSGAGRGWPPGQPWSQPDRLPGCGQHRLNPCGNSRPAAATATREHRKTARHLPMNPFMSPGRVARRTLRTK